MLRLFFTLLMIRDGLHRHSGNDYHIELGPRRQAFVTCFVLLIQKVNDQEHGQEDGRSEDARLRRPPVSCGGAQAAQPPAATRVHICESAVTQLFEFTFLEL